MSLSAQSTLLAHPAQHCTEVKVSDLKKNDHFWTDLSDCWLCQPSQPGAMCPLPALSVPSVSPLSPLSPVPLAHPPASGACSPMVYFF